MITIEREGTFLVGPHGSLQIREDDEVTLRLGMLFEGECEGHERTKIAKRYGYTRQRYHQLLQKFKTEGADGLRHQKRGPQGNYRRTDDVVRQIIMYRFFDPTMSPEVIAQKLKQCGYHIGIRSVERVISDYGLQKKTSPISAGCPL